MEKRIYTYELTAQALETEFWDEEAVDGLYDFSLLLALGRLEIVSGPWAPASSDDEKNVTVSSGLHVIVPRRGPVSSQLAMIWVRLVSGSLAYAHTSDGWEFYKKIDGKWQRFDPIMAGGSQGLDCKSLNQAAWLASKIGVGHRIDVSAFSIDGIPYRAVTRAGWETLESYSPEGEPLIAVSTPDDADDRLELLAEAWGHDQTEFMSMVAFYLASPMSPTHFFLIADEGGTGKSSFESAFTREFSTISTMGLDASNLKQNGFTGGAALVPLVGKRVAFADESGALGDNELATIAALTTGAVKQVRYGGGRIGLEHFALKLMFSSNQASSFSALEAVGRRKVDVPTLGFKPRGWWMADADKLKWPNQSRWDVCFSSKTIHALVSHGWELWNEKRGEWPDTTVSCSSLIKMSYELTAAIDDAKLMSLEPTSSGVFNVLYADFPAGDMSNREKKYVRREAEAVAGLGVKQTSINGKIQRYVAIVDKKKWAAVEAKLASEEQEAEQDAEKQAMKEEEKKQERRSVLQAKWREVMPATPVPNTLEILEDEVGHLVD